VSRRRRYLSYASSIGIIAGIIYYIVQGNISPTASIGKDEVVVVNVVDGDTIRVRYQGAIESVRFLGIDAPEHDQEEWGERATNRLKSLVPPGSVVVLEFDVQKRDKYNRLLGYVFTKDGVFVNEIMLKEGLAMLYTFPPNVKYVDRLRNAQTLARGNNVGIWGPNGLSMTPQEYRKSKKR